MMLRRLDPRPKQVRVGVGVGVGLRFSANLDGGYCREWTRRRDGFISPTVLVQQPQQQQQREQRRRRRGNLMDHGSDHAPGRHQKASVCSTRLGRASSTDDDDSPAAHATPIVVVGAGVLGLSICNLLQSTFTGRTVTLLAAELPSSTSSPSASSYTPSYASPWAGAHYRPIFPSTPQLRAEFALANRTFEVMRQIAEDTPEAGVKLMQGFEYLDRPSEGESSLKDGDLYAGPGDGFRVLNGDELIEGANWGCEYTTYSVNVPRYLAHLLTRFEEKGGRVVRRRIESALAAFDVDKDEVGGEVSTVVNCSGTNFGQDAKVGIIRGQTVLVKNPYHRTVTRQYADGRWATLIPRPLDGGTIIGVSKEIGDEEENARQDTRRLLLEQSVECFPDFVEKLDQFEVVQDNVGRRPFREGGLRMEVEEVDNGRKRIVHGYGAGGRGYELSWAVAERLVELLNPGEAVEAKPP